MKEKSRVLILTTAYLPEIGGSELAIKNITDRLPEIFFDLITSRPFKKLSKVEQMGNVTVHRVGGSFTLFSFLLPKNFFPVAVFLKAIQLMFKNGSYDLIHAYQASQAAGGGWLIKWFYPGVKFIITLQEGEKLDKQSLFTKFFRGLILQKTDYITAISDYLAKYARTQNQKTKISIIPNGVDLKNFKFPDSNFQSNFGFQNSKLETKIVITVSRLVPKNGLNDLIKAFRILDEKYKIKNAKLLIVGEGPQREKLFKLSEELGIRSKVNFLGHISNENLGNYLASASVFVRPSLSEGLGIAFLEAMAAGVPIIGTPVGGIPDFLKDGETGLFCRVGDPEDIAEKINRILTDDELKNKLILNARKLVEEKYDWDKIAGEFRNIYDSLQ